MKSLNVDGVVVDCWWGIVEGWSPQKYTWLGYRELFMIIREFQLKVQVVAVFVEFFSSSLCYFYNLILVLFILIPQFTMINIYNSTTKEKLHRR